MERIGQRPIPRRGFIWKPSLGSGSDLDTAGGAYGALENAMDAMNAMDDTASDRTATWETDAGSDAEPQNAIGGPIDTAGKSIPRPFAKAFGQDGDGEARRQALEEIAGMPVGDISAQASLRWLHAKGLAPYAPEPWAEAYSNALNLHFGPDAPRLDREAYFEATKALILEAFGEELDTPTAPEEPAKAKAAKARPKRASARAGSAQEGSEPKAPGETAGAKPKTAAKAKPASRRKPKAKKPAGTARGGAPSSGAPE